MPIQAYVLFRAADGYGSSGTPNSAELLPAYHWFVGAAHVRPAAFPEMPGPYGTGLPWLAGRAASYSSILKYASVTEKGRPKKAIIP